MNTQRSRRSLPLAIVFAIVGCSDDTTPVTDLGLGDWPLAGEGGTTRDRGGEGTARDLLAPDTTAPGSSFAFFAFGDTRTNLAPFQANITSMMALDPQAIGIFNGGDLTANGTVSQWNAHHKVLADGGKGKVRTDLTDWTPGSLRYLGAIGNHDVSDSNWFNNWNAYLPGQQGLGKNAKDGIYFALTHEDALFVVLDSLHTSTAQTDWLKSTLQAVDPAKIRWRFAFFHYPVYPCNDKGPFSGGIPWVREFEKHKFDIVFVADSHTYERTCPMVGGTCQDGGVIYLNSSGGGAPVRDVLPDKEAKVGTDSYHCGTKGAEPGILAKGIGNWYHYCHLQIQGPKLTSRCFSHDKTTDPQDTLILEKQ